MSKKRTAADIDAFSQVLAECGIETSWDRGVSIFNEMVKFFNGDPAYEKEQKLKAAADKAEATKAIYYGLRSRADKAPVYNGLREHAMTVSEILKMLGVKENRMTKTLTRQILESESTGWGLVAVIQQVRLYAKSRTR